MKVKKFRVSEILAVIFLGMLLLAGCGRGEEAPPAFEYRKEYQRGPLSVTILVDHSSISLADEVLFRIETALQENYLLQPISFGENLEGFGIRNYRDESARLDGDGRTVEARWYRLEPFFTGTLSLPAITIRFTEQEKEEGGKQPHELVTEPVEISVTSLLEQDRENLVLKPSRGVVSLPGKTSPLVGIVAGVLFLVTILGFYLFRRRKSEAQKMIVPAHVKALARLQRLAEEKLLENGEIKVFYYLLSEILRYYLEDRYGLRAPEQTSEEFLRDLTARTDLSGTHKDVLRSFLGRTDPVKYATYVPPPEEIQSTFTIVKNFILATRLEEPLPAVNGEGGVAHAVR